MTNPGYTRRQELACTLEELERYAHAILYENEILYVKQKDGTYAAKIGDGITRVGALPYSINYCEIKQLRDEIFDSIERVENLTARFEPLQTPGNSTEQTMSQKAITEIVAETNNSKWYNFHERMSDISLGSGGHVSLIYTPPETRMRLFIDASNSEQVTDNLTLSDEFFGFTDYIKCGKYLFANVRNTTDRIVIYFYVKTDAGYEITWDVLKVNTVTGVRNYLGKVAFGQMFTLPDNCYIRVCKIIGDIDLYTWDGKDCGVSLSAGIDYMASTGEIAVSTTTNRYTTVIPSNARLLFTDGTIRMYTIIGIKEDGTFDIINNEYGIYCFEFGNYANAYTSYMVTLEWLGDGKVLYNELSTHLICITDEMCLERVVGDSKKYLQNALIVNNLAWTPKKDMLLRRVNDVDLYYRKGITYHGIPYGGKWDAPHFVGPHVSPHTFVNAVNDENSILYTETISMNDGHTRAPYYGIVCSSYVSMICGFPCINTNAGFLHSPHIVNNFYDNAPLGIIWSDGGHCVVPVSKYHAKDISIVRIAESLKPLSTITTRYSNVPVERNAFSHYNGATYFDNMFYTARHKRQKGDLDALPYADFGDTVITNGSARPHKGDKCVYKAGEQIQINLYHGDNDVDRIRHLYLETPSEVLDIEVDPSANSIDVADYVGEPGIYNVSTDLSSVKESFEFVYSPSVDVVINATDNTMEFLGPEDFEFWYALCEVGGDELLDRGGEIACVEYEKSKDYSKWFENGHTVKDCQAIFCKGQYGAYTCDISVTIL